RAGFITSAPAGYGYWPGYYANYGDPYGGYLNGAANVITAQGGFLNQTQEAYLKKEQVRAAQLDNRRKAFDEWRYEKSLTPTLEEKPEEERIQKVRRSRTNPPLTEIWSGKALNDLLTSLQLLEAAGIPGPTVYLNQELLPHINVTTGTTTAGLGVLKNG